MSTEIYKIASNSSISELEIIAHSAAKLEQGNVGKDDGTIDSQTQNLQIASNNLHLPLSDSIMNAKNDENDLQKEGKNEHPDDAPMGVHQKGPLQESLLSLREHLYDKRLKSTGDVVASPKDSHVKSEKEISLVSQRQLSLKANVVAESNNDQEQHREAGLSPSNGLNLVPTLANETIESSSVANISEKIKEKNFDDHVATSNDGGDSADNYKNKSIIRTTLLDADQSVEQKSNESMSKAVENQNEKANGGYASFVDGIPIVPSVVITKDAEDVKEGGEYQQQYEKKESALDLNKGVVGSKSNWSEIEAEKRINNSVMDSKDKASAFPVEYLAGTNRDSASDVGTKRQVQAHLNDSSLPVAEENSKLNSEKELDEQEHKQSPEKQTMSQESQNEVHHEEEDQHDAPQYIPHKEKQHPQDQEEHLLDGLAQDGQEQQKLESPAAQQQLEQSPQQMQQIVRPQLPTRAKNREIGREHHDPEAQDIVFPKPQRHKLKQEKVPQPQSYVDSGISARKKQGDLSFGVKRPTKHENIIPAGEKDSLNDAQRSEVFSLHIQGLQQQQQQNRENQRMQNMNGKENGYEEEEENRDPGLHSNQQDEHLQSHVEDMKEQAMDETKTENGEVDEHNEFSQNQAKKDRSSLNQRDGEDEGDSNSEETVSERRGLEQHLDAAKEEDMEDPASFTNDVKVENRLGNGRSEGVEGDRDEAEALHPPSGKSDKKAFSSLASEPLALEGGNAVQVAPNMVEHEAANALEEMDFQDVDKEGPNTWDLQDNESTPRAPNPESRALLLKSLREKVRGHTQEDTGSVLAKSATSEFPSSENSKRASSSIVTAYGDGEESQDASGLEFWHILLGLLLIGSALLALYRRKLKSRRAESRYSRRAAR